MHMQQKNATQSMQHATQSLHTQHATQSMQRTACNRRNIRHVICTCDSEHVTCTCRHAKRDLRDARCSAPVTFCDFIPYLTNVGTCSSTARRVSRSITVTPANQAGQCTHAHTRTRAHAYPRPDGDRAPLSTTLCVRSPSTRPIGPIASTSSCLHCAVLVPDARRPYVGMTRLFIVPQSAIYSATPRQDRRPYGRKALITEPAERRQATVEVAATAGK
jgi:hypothetical protein